MSAEIIKIVIVDDHSIIIEGIKSLLMNESEMKVVAECRNGEEAYNTLCDLDADVLLMDIEMPVLNGFDATIKIKKKFSEVKIIAISTHFEKSIIERMLECGADGYISKNTNKENLLNAINTVYEGQKFLSHDIFIARAKTESSISFKDNPDEANSEQLTKREKEILSLIASGFKNKEIGEKLFISTRTVETHKTNIMNKLGFNSTIELIRFAMKNYL